MEETAAEKSAKAKTIGKKRPGRPPLVAALGLTGLLGFGGGYGLYNGGGYGGYGVDYGGGYGGYGGDYGGGYGGYGVDYGGGYGSFGGDYGGGFGGGGDY